MGLLRASLCPLVSLHLGPKTFLTSCAPAAGRPHIQGHTSLVMFPFNPDPQPRCGSAWTCPFPRASTPGPLTIAPEHTAPSPNPSWGVSSSPLCSRCPRLRPQALWQRVRGLPAPPQISPQREGQRMLTRPCYTRFSPQWLPVPLEQDGAPSHSPQSAWGSAPPSLGCTPCPLGMTCVPPRAPFPKYWGPEPLNDLPLT